MPCIAKGQKHQLRRERFILSGEDYVFVRELSSKEVVEFQRANKDKAEPLSLDAEMLARCLVDDTGLPIFSDGKDLLESLNVGMSTWKALNDKVLEVSGIKPGKN